MIEALKGLPLSVRPKTGFRSIYFSFFLSRRAFSKDMFKTVKNGISYQFQKLGVSRSCPTCVTHVITRPVNSLVRQVTFTKRERDCIYDIYPISYVKQIFHKGQPTHNGVCKRSRLGKDQYWPQISGSSDERF